MATTKEVAERMYAALNTKDVAAVDELWSEDCEMTFPGATVRGREQVKTYIQAYATALPDYQHQIVTMTEAGERVAVELSGRGTHSGPLHMGGREFPATGRQVTDTSCDVITVVGGRIASWHIYTDMASFLAQLGQSPAPAAVPA